MKICKKHVNGKKTVYTYNIIYIYVKIWINYTISAVIEKLNYKKGIIEPCFFFVFKRKKHNQDKCSCSSWK